MTPQASFVIPVKDGAAYLAETLDSCLAQTRSRWEAVIVDDGSTDSTPKIIDYYEKKDERFRSIVFPVNRGRSAARNAGCIEAVSDILLMLDADDLCFPNRLADTLSFFKKNPRTHICYGQFQVMDALGKILGHQDATPMDWEKSKKEKLWYIGHSTLAFRKKVFEKAQYTVGDWSDHAIDDWKFIADCHKEGLKFGPIQRMMMKYRWMPKPRDEEKILALKTEWLSR